MEGLEGMRNIGVDVRVAGGVLETEGGSWRVYDGCFKAWGRCWRVWRGI